MEENGMLLVTGWIGFVPLQKQTENSRISNHTWTVHQFHQGQLRAAQRQQRNAAYGASTVRRRNLDYWHSTPLKKTYLSLLSKDGILTKSLQLKRSSHIKNIGQQDILMWVFLNLLWKWLPLSVPLQKQIIQSPLKAYVLKNYASHIFPAQYVVGIIFSNSNRLYCSLCSFSSVIHLILDTCVFVSIATLTGSFFINHVISKAKKDLCISFTPCKKAVQTKQCTIEKHFRFTVKQTGSGIFCKVPRELLFERGKTD